MTDVPMPTEIFDPSYLGPYMGLDPSKDSHALIGAMCGIGAVLQHVGYDITMEIEESFAGYSIQDLGLEDAPDGLSVWVGHFDYSEVISPTAGDVDCDVEPVGTFRPLTADEWSKLAAGEPLWDVRDWIDPQHLAAYDASIAKDKIGTITPDELRALNAMTPDERIKWIDARSVRMVVLEPVKVGVDEPTQWDTYLEWFVTGRTADGGDCALAIEATDPAAALAGARARYPEITWIAVDPEPLERVRLTPEQVAEFDEWVKLGKPKGATAEMDKVLTDAELRTGVKS